MMRLVQLPAFDDNYIYVASGPGGDCFVVDPGEAGPVINFFDENPKLHFAAIVNTHHHPDHVGANETLKERFGCEVICAEHDKARIPGFTKTVKIGQQFDVAGIKLEVLDVKAHTLGHVAYRSLQAFDETLRHGHGGRAQIIEAFAHRPVLFVGDSLFAAGCGRLFEGTPEDLQKVMHVYAALKEDYLVACAHEYTETNLRFALTVLPNDPNIKNRLLSLEQEKGSTRSSVPFLLSTERHTNPFLMSLKSDTREQLAQEMGLSDHQELNVLKEIRALRDVF